MSQTDSRPPVPFNIEEQKPSSKTLENTETSTKTGSINTPTNPKVKLEVTWTQATLMYAAAFILVFIWVTNSSALQISVAFGLTGGAYLSLSMLAFLVVATLFYGLRRLNKNQIVLLMLSAGLSVAPAINSAPEVRALNAFAIAGTTMCYLRSLMVPSQDPLSNIQLVFQAIGGFFAAQGRYLSPLMHRLFERKQPDSSWDSSTSAAPTADKPMNLQSAGTTHAASASKSGPVLGLIGAIALVLFVLLPMLAPVNPMFSVFTHAIQRWTAGLFTEDLTWRLLRILVLTPLAASLLCAVFVAPDPALRVSAANPSITVLQMSTIVSVLGVLDVFYILWCSSDLYFLATQSLWLGSVSEAARTGFFQLVVVAGINLGVITYLCKSLPAHAGTPLYSLGLGLSYVLVLSTASLIVSAAWRMGAYVARFGLTLLRLFTLWGMLVIAVVLLLWVVKLARPQLKVFKAFAVFALATWCALCLARPAKLCADFNARTYLAGQLNEFDVYTMSAYGADAFDALSLVAQSEKPEAWLAEQELFQAYNQLNVASEASLTLDEFAVLHNRPSLQEPAQ